MPGRICEGNAHDCSCGRNLTEGSTAAFQLACKSPQAVLWFVAMTVFPLDSDILYFIVQTITSTPEHSSDVIEEGFGLCCLVT